MIKTNNLTKYFGSLAAVKDVSFTVGAGEVFGLLGPNGAGKTTTIRMLTTLLAPSSGTASVTGFDVTAEPLKVKKNIGVVPQMLNFDIDLTVAENLEFHGRLHNMKPSDRAARTEELLHFVGLWEKRDTPVEHLSGGMRRRLLIARGLMHRPAVIFMDEPTVGLDPQARRMIWGSIEALKRSGITILLTTHYIEEADALCDRVAIMRAGSIIALDTPTGSPSCARGASSLWIRRLRSRRGWDGSSSNASADMISPGNSSRREKRRSMKAGASVATL